MNTPSPGNVDEPSPRRGPFAGIVKENVTLHVGKEFERHPTDSEGVTLLVHRDSPTLYFGLEERVKMQQRREQNIFAFGFIAGVWAFLALWLIVVVVMR